MAGGTRIRDATVADARAIAEVHAAAWRSGYRGVLDDEIIEAVSAEERERIWRRALRKRPERGFALVAETAARVGGFCSVSIPSPDPDLPPQVAEIGALYVAPDLWRRRIGTALVDRAISELRGKGCRRVTLWALAGHAPVLEFYTRLGFAPDGAERVREQTGGAQEIRLASRLSPGAKGSRRGVESP